MESPWSPDEFFQNFRSAAEIQRASAAAELPGRYGLKGSKF
jgi:hypothetical protein